jgi:glycosyltransferase involved in cell wall biosynthesis
VVIDGSPDNSKVVAESFTDKKIFIYEKPNGGLSDARNYGLQRAKGEFIYFMDSDDWIESDLLEKTIRLLERDKLDVIIFGYKQDDMDRSENLIASHSILPNESLVKKSDKNKEIDAHLLGLLGYAWNKVYRRSFLVSHNLKFEKGISLVEDILFNAQVYNEVSELHFIKEAYYHYLNRPSATLIKKYHPDSFQLKLRRNQTLKILFDAWNFKNKEEAIALSQIQGIRYCIHNLFFFKNELSFKEKTAYIKEMINHSFTRDVINSYAPKSLKDKVFKELVKSRQAFLLAILAQLIK